MSLSRQNQNLDLRGTLSWFMQRSGCTAQQVGKMVVGMLSSQGQASSPETTLLQQQLQQLQQQPLGLQGMPTLEEFGFGTSNLNPNMSQFGSNPMFPAYGA